jgi:hypothetical protein
MSISPPRFSADHIFWHRKMMMVHSYVEDGSFSGIALSSTVLRELASLFPGCGYGVIFGCRGLNFLPVPKKSTTYLSVTRGLPHMRPFRIPVIIILIVALSCTGCTTQNPRTATSSQTIDGITIPGTNGPPTPEEARQIAAAAYVYGYPLVFMDVLKEHQTAVPAPDILRGLAPVNQMMRVYQVPIDKVPPRAPWPITDASYVAAWFDLEKEPVVLSVPASDGRYYILMLENPWTEDLSSVGSRTTGDGPGDYTFVGPGWNGTLPPGMTKIQSSTRYVMLGGRAQMDGPADTPATAAFLDNITLTPLSAWGTNYTPPATVPVTSNVTPNALASASAAVVANMSPDAFYDRLATAMVGSPPYGADKPVLDQIARIGIVPGTPFDWSGMNATIQDAIARGYLDGIAQVNAAAVDWPGKVEVHGWKVVYDMGDYGTNYTLRAGLAAGYGAGNLAEDALYWWSSANASGVPYSGGNRYVLHFDRNSIPPVNTFWSVTMYDIDGRFVQNSLDHYAISSHAGNPAYNPDGSLDIYIQETTPGADK